MEMYSDFALDSLEQDEFKRKKKRKNPFDIDSELNIDDLDISEKQRNALKKLDMANQLTIIRALREGQELKNSNYGTQYAKNDRSSVEDEDNQHSTKSDHYSLAVHSKDNTHEIFNRVFHKTLGEEGGYEDRRNKIDAPTNMGIRQDTLDRFKKAHPKESSNLPIKVRDLSLEQAKLIAKTDFFDKYRINELKHKALQETMFDAFFNHSPIAPALWAQKSINQHTSLHVTEDGVFGSETINALNSLSAKELVIVNNSIIDMRQADYEQEKKTNKNPHYKEYTVGLPSRFDRFRID